METGYWIAAIIGACLIVAAATVWIYFVTKKNKTSSSSTSPDSNTSVSTPETTQETTTTNNIAVGEPIPGVDSSKIVDPNDPNIKTNTPTPVIVQIKNVESGMCLSCNSQNFEEPAVLTTCDGKYNSFEFALDGTISNSLGQYLTVSGGDGSIVFSKKSGATSQQWKVSNQNILPVDAIYGPPTENEQLILSVSQIKSGSSASNTDAIQSIISQSVVASTDADSLLIASGNSSVNIIGRELTLAPASVAINPTWTII